MESNEIRDLGQYLTAYTELPFERIAEKFRRRHVVTTLRRLNITSLAEIGCGMRSIFFDLPSTIGGLVVEPITELLERQQELGERCKLINQRLEDIRLDRNEKVDCVLMSSILHEVESPSNFLHSAKTILRRHGRVLCVVPNALSFHRYLGVQKRIIEDLTSRSETQDSMQQKSNAFTPESLRELADSVGLFNVQTSTFFPKLLSHQQMQRLYDEGSVRDADLDFLDSLSDLCDPAGSELLMIGTFDE